MAFNAQQAGRTRIIVVVVAAVAVLAIVIAILFAATPLMVSSSQTSGDAQTAGTAATTDTSSDAQASMDTIDAQYGTTVKTLNDQYEADPSNPSSLLNLANSYFDWGVAAINHASSDEDQQHAREIFTQAIEHYDMYLEANPTSKSVVVDRAICIFYAGDTERAISELEGLVAEDASFAPAWANLGMFYESEGRTDDAKQAYETAIDAAGDDDAYNVKDYAEQRLSALDAS